MKSHIRQSKFSLCSGCHDRSENLQLKDFSAAVEYTGETRNNEGYYFAHKKSKPATDKAIKKYMKI